MYSSSRVRFDGGAVSILQLTFTTDILSTRLTAPGSPRMSRAVKPREIPRRPYSLFLEHGSAAKTLISQSMRSSFQSRGQSRGSSF